MGWHWAIGPKTISIAWPMIRRCGWRPGIVRAGGCWGNGWRASPRSRGCWISWRTWGTIWRWCGGRRETGSRGTCGPAAITRCGGRRSTSTVFHWKSLAIKRGPPTTAIIIGAAHPTPAGSASEGRIRDGCGTGILSGQVVGVPATGAVGHPRSARSEDGAVVFGAGLFLSGGGLAGGRNGWPGVLGTLSASRHVRGSAGRVQPGRRHVKAALRWAKRRGYISEVPDFKGVFIREDRKQPVIIPEEDFMEMVKALRNPQLVLKYRPAEWWRVFLYVAYYLGLRQGEILGLTWDRVSLDTLEVHVVASSSKSRKDRVIGIPPEIGIVVRQWRERQPDAKGSDPVFPWPCDAYHIYEDWHAIQKAAGIKDGEHYVPKNCRSSCASELIAAKVPTIVVKGVLGRATVATMENYYVNTKPALRLPPTPGRCGWRMMSRKVMLQMMADCATSRVTREKSCGSVVEVGKCKQKRTCSHLAASPFPQMGC